MARGEDTRHHPNRKVDWNNIIQGILINPLKSQNLAQDNDNAPAGGIKRPEMESCTNCGTETPKGSGSCADCK